GDVDVAAIVNSEQIRDQVTGHFTNELSGFRSEHSHLVLRNEKRAISDHWLQPTWLVTFHMPRKDMIVANLTAPAVKTKHCSGSTVDDKSLPEREKRRGVGT